MDVQRPSSNGWEIEDGYLDIMWMTCNPAPEEVLELVSCSCKDCDNSCPCATLEFVCTDACKCITCVNCEEIADYVEDEEDDDELESDEEFV